jgi:hypothetical protein
VSSSTVAGLGGAIILRNPGSIPSESRHRAITNAVFLGSRTLGRPPGTLFTIMKSCSRLWGGSGWLENDLQAGRVISRDG